MTKTATPCFSRPAVQSVVFSPYCKALGRNPPQVGVTSDLTLCTEVIHTVLQTSLRLFLVSSQEKSFLITPNVEKKFWNHMKHLKITGEMERNWWWNFTCAISLNFEIYFLEFSYKIASAIISGNYLYLKLYENFKRTVKYLKLLWFKVFCPLETENCSISYRIPSKYKFGNSSTSYFEWPL